MNTEETIDLIHLTKIIVVMPSHQIKTIKLRRNAIATSKVDIDQSKNIMPINWYYI
jgi:hypothetical protein